jgi:hypothetical protein
MQMETEQNNVKLKQLTPSKKPKESWLIEQLGLLAVRLGETITPERLALYVEDLADLTQDQIERALWRSRRELRFFPKVAELCELAGISHVQQQDAEARTAWDVLTCFVGRYVSNDQFGNYGPEHGWYPNKYAKLTDRILDTVRRTGGWKVYKCMTAEDFPFVQKRFFAEYHAWIAVEQITPSRLLTGVPHLQLVAKPIEAPCRTAQAQTEQPVAAGFKPKPIPEPMSEAQIEDRRAMLRQQASSLVTKRGHHE